MLTKPNLQDFLNHYFKMFHQHPELSNREFWTTEEIRTILKYIGITPNDKYKLKTGVIADIKGRPGPMVALRADIDGLPVQEKTNLLYRPKIKNVTHACGHDFHLTALLAAAYLLNQEKTSLLGTVRLIFEPGEENHTGANLIINSGALKGVKAIFGMHNMPNIPVGTVGIKSGKLMASNDNFQVIVYGQGSHAAMPHTGKDPIVCTATIISTLQTIVSRNTDPNDRLVVTIGSIHGGFANNVIPDEVTFKGTIRAFSSNVRKQTKQRFNKLVQDIASSFGEKSDVIWDQGPSPVNNNPLITKTTFQEATNIMQVITPNLTNTDDDFANYQEKVPGCYVFMGSKGSSNLHHDDLVVNLKGLEYGAKLHIAVAKALLKKFEKDKLYLRSFKKK